MLEFRIISIVSLYSLACYRCMEGLVAKNNLWEHLNKFPFCNILERIWRASNKRLTYKLACSMTLEQLISGQKATSRC